MLSRAPGEIFRLQLAGILLITAGFLFLPGRALCQIAKDHSKFLGNVIGTYIPPDFAKYWDQVTPENAGKWGNVGVSPDTESWHWSHLDSIYEFAVSNGFPFKFHNLVWGPQQPTWIATLPPAQQKKMVETWIADAGRRYPKTAMVDVVNEPIQKPPVYKNALGGDGSTGWDWVVWSYQAARKAFPHSRLLINEYNILRSRDTTEEYIGLIDTLKHRNLLDGIGCQGHFLEDVSSDTIASNLRLLAGTGLPIYISEYDVNEADDSTQLAIFKKQFPIFWSNPAVKGVTLWGYIQGIIWRTDSYLVRTDGKARPALKWLSRYVTSGSSGN
jgi:endo-1,4-beta-xylanase